MSKPFQTRETFRMRFTDLVNGKFIERLGEAYKGKDHLTQSEMAQIMGVTRQAIGGWTLSDKAPSSTVVVNLAKAYHISTDWILGVSDIAFYETGDVYAAFKELGFSVETYNTLKMLKEQNEERYAEYMEVLNLIISNTSSSLSMVEGETVPVEKPINPLLKELYNYLNPNNPAQYWITATHPADLIDLVEKGINTTSDENLQVRTLPTYKELINHLRPCDNEMYEAYSISKISQILSDLKSSLQDN